ncbi:hypothetical protein TNCV_1348671 [Trichonephila clavipes]|nr:hypothetical protein TNCV_1348671 [Trichonephila clavipes]
MRWVYETPAPSVEENARISAATERIRGMLRIFQNLVNAAFATQHSYMILTRLCTPYTTWHCVGLVADRVVATVVSAVAMIRCPQARLQHVQLLSH